MSYDDHGCTAETRAHLSSEIIRCDSFDGHPGDHTQPGPWVGMRQTWSDEDAARGAAEMEQV